MSWLLQSAWPQASGFRLGRWSADIQGPVGRRSRNADCTALAQLARDGEGSRSESSECGLSCRYIDHGHRQCDSTPIIAKDVDGSGLVHNAENEYSSTCSVQVL